MWWLLDLAYLTGDPLLQLPSVKLRLANWWNKQHLNQNCKYFFYVGPPKEDIFSGNLLSPIFQSVDSLNVLYSSTNTLLFHPWIELFFCASDLVLLCRFSFLSRNLTMWSLFAIWQLLVVDMRHSLQFGISGVMYFCAEKQSENLRTKKIEQFLKPHYWFSSL